MPASFIQTDLNVLFASSVFGEASGDVVYENKFVMGIFDDEDIDVTMAEGVAQIIRQPTFTCPSSQVPNLVDGKTITIRGAVFRIKNWKDDGTGVVEIYLERT